MTWNLSGSTLSLMNFIHPRTTPVLLTEVLLNPGTNRQQITQIMFHKFNTPAIFIANQAALALLFIALTTGIVLHSGYSVSHAVPTYQFHSFPLLDLNSQVVIWLIILNICYYFTTTTEKKIVQDIKEKLCYVVLDYEQGMANAALLSYLREIYALPDGQIITIGNAIQRLYSIHLSLACLLLVL